MRKEIVRDTRVTVDLGRLKHNMQLIREMVGDEVAIMPVIKANGYGHGAVGIAPTLMECGVTYLAVATLSEALDLKEANPDYPVFILGHTPDRFLHYIIENNITQTVFSLEQVKLLGELAGKAEKKAKVHVKLDTGFHRLGCMPTPEFEEEVYQMFQVENV